MQCTHDRMLAHRLWARLHIWKRSPTAAFLFGHLHPLDEELCTAAVPDGERAAGERLDALTGKPVKAGSSTAVQPASEQKCRCGTGRYMAMTSADVQEGLSELLPLSFMYSSDRLPCPQAPL